MLKNKQNRMLLEFEQRITRENILFFDMDGTLIDSDYANYLAYAEAVHLVLGLEIASFCTPAKRVTRESLKREISGLTRKHFDEIIQLKNEIYVRYICATEANALACCILKKYSGTNKTVLVTNCRKERAMAVLEYHNIINDFSCKIYRNDSCGQNGFNKYQHAIKVLNVDPGIVFAFENDETEIRAAISVGISGLNIHRFHDVEEGS